MRCPCDKCGAARSSKPIALASDRTLRRAVAEAICTSVIRGDAIGGTHTVYSDWNPEADAAIAAITNFGRATHTHQWSDRGSSDDLWRECWLCGLQEDR